MVVTGHTGEVPIGPIYDEIFIKKVNLTPVVISEQCTWAAFDGVYFSRNSYKNLANHIAEQANVAIATRSDIQNLEEWVIWTWDPTLRLVELVAKDIRVDMLRVDVELVSVP